MREYTKLRNVNRGYMKLVVWQKAIDLAKLVSQLVPKQGLELKLRAQIMDAAQSVGANISEGYSRRSINEYIQHLYIALGSMSEVFSRLLCVKETGLLADLEFRQFDVLHYEIENKMLNLIRSLEEKRKTGTWIDRLSEDLAEYNT